jgi:hypothetical protein
MHTAEEALISDLIRSKEAYDVTYSDLRTECKTFGEVAKDARLLAERSRDPVPL